MKYVEIKKIQSMTPKELLGKQPKIKERLGYYQPLFKDYTYDVVWIDYKSVPLLVVMINNKIV